MPCGAIAFLCTDVCFACIADADEQAAAAADKSAHKPQTATGGAADVQHSEAGDDRSSKQIHDESTKEIDDQSTNQTDNMPKIEAEQQVRAGVKQTAADQHAEEQTAAGIPDEQAGAHKMAAATEALAAAFGSTQVSRQLQQSDEQSDEQTAAAKMAVPSAADVQSSEAADDHSTKQIDDQSTNQIDNMPKIEAEQQVRAGVQQTAADQQAEEQTELAATAADNVQNCKAGVQGIAAGTSHEQAVRVNLAASVMLQLLAKQNCEAGVQETAAADNPDEQAAATKMAAAATPPAVQISDAGVQETAAADNPDEQAAAAKMAEAATTDVSDKATADVIRLADSDDESKATSTSDIPNLRVLHDVLPYLGSPVHQQELSTMMTQIPLQSDGRIFSSTTMLSSKERNLPFLANLHNTTGGVPSKFDSALLQIVDVRQQKKSTVADIIQMYFGYKVQKSSSGLWEPHLQEQQQGWHFVNPFKHQNVFCGAVVLSWGGQQPNVSGGKHPNDEHYLVLLSHLDANQEMQFLLIDNLGKSKWVTCSGLNACLLEEYYPAYGVFFCSDVMNLIHKRTNASAMDLLLRLSKLRHDGRHSCCVDVIISIFHCLGIASVMQIAGILCLPESGTTDEMASAQNLLLHLSSASCDLREARDHLVLHFERHFVDVPAHIDQETEQAVPTQMYSRERAGLSNFLCYDLLGAACGQKLRREFASKQHKAIAHASRTWLKVQGSEIATVLLRHAWLVVAKLVAECIKQPQHCALAAAGLRYVADIAHASIKGKMHLCGTGLPAGLPDGVLARAFVLLQIVGCEDLTESTELSDASWGNRVVFESHETVLLDKVGHLLQDAAARLDAGFKPPWATVPVGVCISRGSNDSNQNTTTPAAQQGAKVADGRSEDSKQREQQQQLQEEKKQPEVQNKPSRRTFADAVTKHNNAVEILLVEAALAFTLAFCSLETWNEEVQVTDVPTVRIQLLRQQLDACIAEEEKGAAMTLEQIHSAWSKHVRELPREAPFVDLRMGQVACLTFPLLGDHKETGIPWSLEVPSVQGDRVVEPECGRLFPAFFRTKMTQALVCGFEVNCMCVGASWVCTITDMRAVLAGEARRRYGVQGDTQEAVLDAAWSIPDSRGHSARRTGRGHKWRCPSDARCGAVDAYRRL